MKKTVNILAAVALATGTFVMADAYAGAEAKCKACHDFGADHKAGPALKGIVGRKAGSTDFGKYSASLKGANWVWDEANLRKWIADSKEAIKELTGDANAKTSMPPQKVTGDKADEVINFLKGL